jgi:hypothetical protein
LEAVFSVRSVQMLYKEDQLPLRPETAVRRVGVWCEVAASMRRSGAEERPLLEAATKQRSEDRD